MAYIAYIRHVDTQDIHTLAICMQITKDAIQRPTFLFSLHHHHHQSLYPNKKGSTIKLTSKW